LNGLKELTGLVETALSKACPVPDSDAALLDLFQYDVPVLGPEGTCRFAIDTFDEAYRSC
jgi:hypothetical protein